MLVNPPSPATAVPTAWWHGILGQATASTFASFLSAFFAMIAAVASWSQVRVNSKHAGSQDRAVRADIFLKIADRWSRVLLIRRNLIDKGKVTTYQELDAQYGPRARDYLISDEWQKTMRPICNFYEILGVMLEQRSIEPEALFVLVTVDTVNKFEGHDAAGNPLQQVGLAIHRQLQGPIEYLRRNYRSDIYVYYDKYLLQAYLQYLENLGFCKADDLHACAQSIIGEAVADCRSDLKLAEKARSLVNQTVRGAKQHWWRMPWKMQ
ncbi:MAG TPA: hypothetical protein VHX20_20400 [Terracidiphilus sp.]|jgi:hypothetical protein|nr:hypothetical protein [Terracidiphilus sp.]